jgi:hypothetical protein
MKFLSYSTGKEWVPIKKSNGDGENQSEPYNKLIQAIISLLLSENLIILCGLGMSRYLKDSYNNSIAPTMFDLWKAAEENARKKSENLFEKIKNKVKYTTPHEGVENIELLLSRCQLVQEIEHDDEIEDFISETEAVIVEKCKFIKDGIVPDVHEAFLRKVARRSPRLPRTKIFTTNYDLCFESAASRSRFIVIDGFSHTYPQEFDGSYFSYDFVRREQGRDVPDYITNVFHLYKLHGSVDWEKKDDQIIKNPNTKKPCIIYPRQGKYQASYEQPFLEMMSRFQMVLRQPNTGLLIIGFGFNDFHLVQPIMSSIEANVGLKLMIVDPSSDYTNNANIKKIINLILAGDTRLSLISAKFEEFVPLIPDLMAATEEELHENRFRNVGRGL